MTSTIVPRRLFDEFPDDDESSGHSLRDAAVLKSNGLIRVQGIIPIDLNEQIKSMAKRKGMNADVLIGQLIQQSRASVDDWEAQQEVARLQLRFGPQWASVLANAACRHQS